MLKIAICDDSRTDVEMLECAFDKLRQYQIEYDVYFSGEELLKYYIDKTSISLETKELYYKDVENRYNIRKEKVYKKMENLKNWFYDDITQKYIQRFRINAVNDERDRK